MKHCKFSVFYCKDLTTNVVTMHCDLSSIVKHTGSTYDAVARHTSNVKRMMSSKLGNFLITPNRNVWPVIKEKTTVSKGNRYKYSVYRNNSLVGEFKSLSIVSDETNITIGSIKKQFETHNHYSDGTVRIIRELIQ